MKQLFVIAALLLSSFYASAQSVPDASTVLKEAYQKAKVEKKNVLLMFHASWCGWCKKMDTALADSSIKKSIEKAFVITHLTVKEMPQKKELENPGAEDILKAQGADKMGIPFWIVYNPEGKILANAIMPNGENTGCPAADEEVAYWISVLKKTTTLSADELAKIEKRFKANK